MANNKMLIDASHPEETRVAVVRGNRIEEFDFESQAKKQLRGNIYLAKVTRVEPSLQAAFIDYGGNRHGFLAFSEIHPDYYQIPVADRLALLEEEAREASESEDDDDGRSQRRRGRKRHSGGSERPGAHATADQTSDNGSEDTAPDELDEDDEGFVDEPEEVTEIIDGREIGDDKDILDPDASEEEAEHSVSPEDADEGNGRSMAAIVESDWISEDAPDEEAEEPGAKAEEPAEVAEKPKRKRRAPAAKKPSTRKAKAEAAAAAEAAEDAPAEIGADEEVVVTVTDQTIAEVPQEHEREPERAEHRRHSQDESEEVIDSVGQEDAMEEVPYRRKLRRQYKIQEVIKRRQIMLVQVVKEERGNKGAALTTYLSLAGRYSVLMPNTARGGGISRKITNAVDRKRLKAIAQELEVPKGMGVILRTAGAMRTKAEIKRDFEYLMRLWENVRTLTLSSTAPCLVYEEGSLIKRSIRDLYDKDTGEVIVHGEAGYREAKDFMRMLMPSHAKNVKPYMEEQALFSRFGVESQLDRLLTPQVTLKSGGYIVINQTEALVSIDVNSGRSTREHSIEDTALQTNLEAADEVARQLRLRDLAGLIVIDFIDMEEKRNNRSVEKRLKDALKYDRARIQVGRISHFGLLEMSRQRIRASVMESTMEVCPHCQGVGHVRSHSSIALHVFRSIEDYLTKHPRFDLIVRCPTVIALDILNHKRSGLIDLEDRFGLKVTIHADTTLPGQSFLIEKGEAATGIPRKPQNYAAMDLPEDDFVEPEITEDDDEVPARAEMPDDETDWQARDTGGGRVQGAGRDNGGAREDRDGRKRRRRRRRGRRPEGALPAEPRDDAVAHPHDNADFYAGEEFVGDAGEGDYSGTNEETQAESTGGSDERSDADGGRRRRRRGRRGGRRNRREDEAGFVSGDLPDGDAVSPNEDSGEESFGEDEVVLGEFQGAVDTAAADEKGPVTELPPTRVASQRVAPEPEAAPRPEPEPETPRGRNTRRPRGQETATTAVEAISQPVTETVEKPEDDDKPRRSGWWRRGRGFF